MEACEGNQMDLPALDLLLLFLSCEEDDVPSEKDRTVIWGIKKFTIISKMKVKQSIKP